MLYRSLVTAALFCIVSFSSPHWLLELQATPITPAWQATTTDLDDLIKLIKEGNDFQQATAAAQLLDHADEYERFAMPLAKLLLERDELLTFTVKRVVKRLGTKLVDALNPDFSGSMDEEQFRALCSVINALGDDCRSFEPKLVQLLGTEKDIFRRVAAMYALTGFSKGSPDAIEHILIDMKYDDMNVTLFATRLVIKTGAAAKQAIPALNNLFENGNISQRSYANWAYAAIGSTDDLDVVALTEKQLAKFNVVERERALISAGLLGADAKDMEPKIREMMGQDYSNLEGPGAVALWKVTGEAEDSIDRLIQVTEDFVEYEVNGPKFLGQLGPAAAPATDFLISRLSSEDISVQIHVLEALGKIGPAAQQHQSEIAKIVDATTSPIVKLVGQDSLTLINATETSTDDEASSNGNDQ